VPTARDHLAVVAAAGRLYALGGRIDGGYAQNLAVVEAYDPTTDQWQTRTPMPTARSGIAAALLFGEIVVIGGEAPAGTFAEVEIYNPKTSRWAALPPMPTPRHGLGAAAVDGRLYVIGGGPKPGATASRAVEILGP
jgi:N-acetylneuraminic acid mutarotase